MGKVLVLLMVVLAVLSVYYVVAGGALYIG